MREILESDYIFEDDGPKEECGVFGVFLPGAPSSLVERITFQGMLDNQHRGEESAGIVIANGAYIADPFTRMGLVRDVYLEYNKLPYHPDGFIGLGHNRYSTTGTSCIENAAPFLAGGIAVAHNGNLTNESFLRGYLKNKGIKLQGTTDSEVLANFIALAPGNDWDEKIQYALRNCEGSFSLAMITKDALYAGRDGVGNRPLFFAEMALDGISGYAVSSETPALDRFPGKIHEVNPGEIIKFNKEGIKRWRYTKEREDALCGLSVAYLLRADGRTRDRIQVDYIRRNLGGKLARLYPPSADIDFVTYIPESAKSTAEGFAEELSRIFGREINIRTGMLKERYGSLNGATRGFINPDNSVRAAIGGSYHPFDWLIGKNIVVIDDSIIRGNTTKGVIETTLRRVGFLKNQGAQNIDLRIIFPPVNGPCFLGTDIKNNDWLIHRELGGDLEKISKYLSVRSVAYLTPEEFQSGVDEAVGKHLGLCLGCSTGKYPVTVFQAEKKIIEGK